MAIKDEVAQIRKRMEKAIDDIRKELSSIRTGRASISILDNIQVDYYGTPTPINQVAQLGTPEINVGLFPMMIMAVLARTMPRRPLLEMMLLGDRWSAAQLQQYGLVNRVVPADRLDDESRKLAISLAEKSTAIMRLGRDAFYRQHDLDFKAALEYLHSQVTLVTLTEDSAEGRKAFFEKRKPNFKGR